MVVVCESCSTRFRMDDVQIPAKGRLVRCSQCKATFVAKPEAVSADDVIDEVVAEVTDAGGPPTPEPSVDLFGASGGDLDDPATRPERPLDTSGDEERWEFDEAPRSAPRSGEPDLAFEDAHPPSPVETPLEEVGEPSDWDLLGDSVTPAASEARFIEPPPKRAAPASKTVEPEPLLAPAPPLAASSRRTVPNGGALARTARGAFAAVGWAVLCVLAVSSVAPLLALDTAPRGVSLPARNLALADGEARAVRGGFVENAFGASLYVVRGEVARPSGDPALGLRVHLVDGAGARTGVAAWAGLEPAARELRELAPERLREALDATARSAARSGRFAAFFDTLPAAAAGFELALEPLPAPPEEAVPAPVSEPAGATASSSPPPLPSSE